MTKQIYFSVQALRGLGALLVVVFHTTVMLHQCVDADITIFDAGVSGVDLFFLISGFIMVVVTQSSWGEPGQAWHFFKRRLIRIVPLYWIMTSVRLVELIVGHHSEMLGSWHIVASYLFIPTWDGHHRARPVLAPGWTLSYEMFFYAAMALCFFFRKAPLIPLSILFSVLALIGFLEAPFSHAALTLLNPRLLEFALGMWIAAAMPKQRAIPAPLGWSVLLACLIAVCCTSGISHEMPYRMLFWGASMALVLCVGIALETAPVWRLPLVRMIGNASYAIYLTHDLPIYAVRFLLRHYQLSGTSALLVGIGLALVLACSVGYAVHRLIERPLTGSLRRIFEPAAPEPVL